MAIIHNMDKNWRFFLGDLPPKTAADGWGGAKARAFGFGAPAADFDDSKWRSVNIPHDFVMEGDYTRKNAGADMQKIPEMESIDSRHFAGGSLEGGIAWYRKRFDIPEDYREKRLYLCFDGIYRNSAVYLNEYYVGSHESGYTSFYYDITDFVNIGGENLLAVRVDASDREGWWYEGGGIYRHVWLEVMNSVYVEKWGAFAASDVNLKNGSAALTIETEVVNKELEARNITVISEILDKNGNCAGKIQGGIAVPAWDSAKCYQTLVIENANLWSLEDTYMYTLKTSLYDGGKETDARLTPFGIRDIRFEADSGFYLNGKHIRIQGLCCHHDHAGAGIAVTEDLWEYRLAQMKSMGANGYRSAHHPPSPGLLDICDREGILVMDETRRMSSCNDDLERLRSMVKRDRNHPSVFIWGIGNEEIFSQDREETARTTITMKAEVKKLDPTRPVTSAVVCWNGKERFDNAQNYIGVTKNLDVMGFNYCRTAWDDYHERMPSQPIIITEASANSSTRGCYSTDEDRGLYYIFDPENETKCKSGKKALRKDLAEAEWKYFAEREYLAGIFLWTGIDYRGEPTPLAYPAVYSQFGILDYCGFPKDNFYYYKSWWSKEDVLHLFPRRQPEKGEKVSFICYSNLDEAELFIGGVSMGRKRVEKNLYVSWENVAYENGAICVKGYRNGAQVMTDTPTFSGVPYEIKLTAYKSEIRENGTAIINVSVSDKNGAVCNAADNEIRFIIEGAGGFLGAGNGRPGDHASDIIPVRRAFNGLCQILARAEEKGEIKISALSDGLKKGECTVLVK